MALESFSDPKRRKSSAIRRTEVPIGSASANIAPSSSKGAPVDEEVFIGTGCCRGDRCHFPCRNGSDRRAALGLTRWSLSPPSRSGLGSQIACSGCWRPARVGHCHQHLCSDRYWNAHGGSGQVVNARGSGRLGCRRCRWVHTASRADGRSRWPCGGTQVVDQPIRGPGRISARLLGTSPG